MSDVTPIDELQALAIHLRRIAPIEMWPLADFVERVLAVPSAPVAASLDAPTHAGDRWRRVSSTIEAALAAADSVSRCGAIADLVGDVARETGDNRLRHAERILVASTGGRPPLDDAEALAEVQRLITEGTTSTTAFLNVARRMAPTGSQVESVRSRLRRKYKTLG